MTVNRNIVSFQKNKESSTRTMLRELLRVDPPKYDHCTHVRTLRTKLRVEDFVLCAREEPTTIFTDLSSSHLYDKDGDGRPRSHVMVRSANDTHAFLQLARCRRYLISTSSFSIAAALLSRATRRNVMIYNDRDCNIQRPLGMVMNMFGV